MKAASTSGPRRSFSSRIGELFAWAVMVVTPLVFLQAKESFRLPKLMVAEWLGLASVLFLAWSLRGARIGVRELWRVPVVRAILPILVVATAGIWTTRHPLQVREALFDLWIGAACLVGWSTGLERERQERLLRGLLWPASALALLGILQYYGIWQPFELTGIRVDPRLGLTSLAGNPGDLAAFLVLPCLVALSGLPVLRSGKSKAAGWLGALALVLCLYVVALSQTLAALLAIVVGGLTYAFVKLPRRKVVLALAGAAVVVGLLIAAFAPLRSRVERKAQALAAGDLNDVLTGRLDGWRAAILMLREHPITGVGHGAYLPEYVPAKLKLLDRGVEFLPDQKTPVFSNAHNELLNAGAEWGIPGLLALGWGIWVLIGAALRGAKDRGLVLAGLAALTVLALAYFPFRVALVAFPAILFLAWVLRVEPVEETDV
jgi:O-antigen ligase